MLKIYKCALVGHKTDIKILEGRLCFQQRLAAVRFIYCV